MVSFLCSTYFENKFTACKQQLMIIIHTFVSVVVYLVQNGPVQSKAILLEQTLLVGDIC